MKIRDKVLSIDDRKLEKMYVQEWDETIYLKTMTAKERDSYIQRSDKMESEAEKSALMIVTFVCESDGSRAFEEADIEKLADKNAAVIDRIIHEIIVLNGLDSDAIENAEKN